MKDSKAGDLSNNGRPSLRAKHELLDLETREAHLGLMKEAGKMLLRERTVNLSLKVLLTLAVIGLEIALFIHSPALFPLSLALLFATALRLVTKDGQESKNGEGDP